MELLTDAVILGSGMALVSAAYYVYATYGGLSGVREAIAVKDTDLPAVAIVGALAPYKAIAAHVLDYLPVAKQGQWAEQLRLERAARQASETCQRPFAQ